MKNSFGYNIFADRMPLPLLQILLSLPCITQQDLFAFEEALSKTGSPKEQKQHMKSLLIMATGNKLKALATQKGINVITNVTSKCLHLDKYINIYLHIYAVSESAELKNRKKCETNLTSNRTNERYLVLVSVLYVWVEKILVMQFLPERYNYIYI